MPDDPSDTGRFAEALAAAMIEPLRDVGTLLATQIDQLRAEVAELRAEFVAHRNDVDYAHRL